MNRDSIDIGRSFTKLVNCFSINHRGVLLERSDGGYKYGNLHFENLEQVDEYINSRFEALGQSYHKTLNKLKNEHEKKDNDPES
jgi:hypothetical protein